MKPIKYMVRIHNLEQSINAQKILNCLAFSWYVYDDDSNRVIHRFIDPTVELDAQYPYYLPPRPPDDIYDDEPNAIYYMPEHQKQYYNFDYSDVLECIDEPITDELLTMIALGYNPFIVVEINEG